METHSLSNGRRCSTVGSEGKFPCLLVFGSRPKGPLPGSLAAAVPHVHRMLMKYTAKEQYFMLAGKKRPKTEEKAYIQSNFSLPSKFGDKVLAYTITTGRWKPKNFVSRDESTIIVMDESDEYQRCAKMKATELRLRTYLLTVDLYGISVKTNLMENNSKPENFEPMNLPDELKNKNEILEIDEMKGKILKRFHNNSGEPVELDEPQFNEVYLTIV